MPHRQSQSHEGTSASVYLHIFSDVHKKRYQVQETQQLILVNTTRKISRVLTCREEPLLFPPIGYQDDDATQTEAGPLPRSTQSSSRLDSDDCATCYNIESACSIHTTVTV